MEDIELCRTLRSGQRTLGLHFMHVQTSLIFFIFTGNNRMATSHINLICFSFKATSRINLICFSRLKYERETLAKSDILRRDDDGKTTVDPIFDGEDFSLHYFPSFVHFACFRIVFSMI